VDAFLVTVKLLQKMGADARPAVPAVIRNAERLGILKKAALSSGNGKRGEIVKDLLENLERMAGTSGESAAKAPLGGGCLYSPLIAAGAGAAEGPAAEARCEKKDAEISKGEELKKTWWRIWFTDHPSHLTPEKVDGAIQ
jgi:hypothetical protein